jgi:hypothetical protein
MADTMFAIWAKLVDRLSAVFASYHPEQHYMRGPGPKWREKHPGMPVA